MRFRFAILFIMLLFGAAASVKAQVAVTELVHAAPRIGDPVWQTPTANFLPPNPAAMQLGAPSRWGGGNIDVERKQTLPVESGLGSFQGMYGGARHLWQRFTIGGYYILNSDKSNIPIQGDWTSLGLGIATSFGKSFAFGLSLETASTERNGNLLDFQKTTLGVNYRISETLYTGVAIGAENIKSSLNGEGSRDVWAAGIGQRKGGGRLLWHMEYYMVNREAAPSLSFEDEFLGSFSHNAVLEVIWNNILFAGTTTINEWSNSGKPIVTGPDSSIVTSYDIGWAPQPGFSIFYRYEATTTTMLDGSEYENRARNFSASWNY